MAIWEDFQRRYQAAKRGETVLPPELPHVATPVVTEGWQSELADKGYVIQPDSEFNNYTKFVNADGRIVHVAVTCCKCYLIVGSNEPLSVAKGQLINYIISNL